MIYTTIPYCPKDVQNGKSLVFYYNQFMTLLPKDSDFACFVDHDAINTTYSWYPTLETITETYPECGCFVGTANRVSSKRQLQGDWNSNDYERHRGIGEKFLNHYGTTVEDFSEPTPTHLSGVFFCLKKSVWRKTGGFKSWNENSNIFGIDSRLHQDLYENGEKVYICKGIYLYHYYRNGNTTNKEHLK